MTDDTRHEYEGSVTGLADAVETATTRARLGAYRWSTTLQDVVLLRAIGGTQIIMVWGLIRMV